VVEVAGEVVREELFGGVEPATRCNTLIFRKE
jgi:hypothetical protein